MRRLDAGSHADRIAGVGQIGLGLGVGLIHRIGRRIRRIGPVEPVATGIIERRIDVGGRDRGGFHPAAHHVKRRMHAGKDTVVAEVGCARQQFLPLLRHQEGDAERLKVG